ncbi:hypothetical protein H2199_008479 [Coniosporium tulheliwenetii]|uniref:Uncharacterized protein n=1 Tax=Coniosporium tulheliwenetii TaxID=3383036 RepID=A0ACC2YJN4_9PEZI|nr:hypothetical protein H2199_008479 [Cladosporium sp. JES 115]
MVPAGPPEDARVFWNPTVMSLPYWSPNQYLLVSRIVTDGTYQENVICEANICHPNTTDLRPGDQLCSEDDLTHLGGAVAKQCLGSMAPYTSIPGFHDPRIFYDGRGAPLMILNTQSRYACFGLWLIDLRALYPPLEGLLASSPSFPSLGPLASYPSLTELTRNPPETRGAMEKNWVVFGQGEEGYISYELTPRRRTFAKLMGAGYTSLNLTDPAEVSCLFDDPALDTTGIDGKTHRPTWHQSTNSLQLVLCRRRDPACVPGAENTVFVTVVHRKHLNAYGLPLRYERYVVVWTAHPPFSMVGVSRYPILFANETVAGWTARENWDDGHGGAPFGNYTLGKRGHSTQGKRDSGSMREMWASFTYTVSIAWAWDVRNRVEVRDKNLGYLDDEVVVGIGIADGGQGFVQVPVRELVGCLRACPVR